MPYIMRTRVDAHDYFEDRLDVGRAELWLRAKRDQGHTEFGFLPLFVAALVRTISQWPRLNRFVVGSKLYARNDISVSLVIKRKLAVESPETSVKILFDPQSTIYDVARSINAAVDETKGEEAVNAADSTVRLLMRLPGWVLKLTMATFRGLDAVGLLPKAIHHASPFHTSFFITDLGSLGIKPIYHHIYEFGTTSLFLAFGGKERSRELTEDGRVVTRKHIGIKIVNDERICDGHYYASAFKYFLKLLKDPSVLESPPECVVQDVV